MSTPTSEETIIGTFADETYADSAADAARQAGFRAERHSGGVVAVETGQHPQRVAEIRDILAAYGAQEYARTEGINAPRGEARRTRVEDGTTVEVVEEQLRTRTRPVQTGEITIRKEVVSETRVIEVPVQREELVIERHAVEPRPVDSASNSTADPLVAQLMDRLQHMRSGETLRLPIVEEEVLIEKRPVVVEEITVGKRSVTETQKVSETIKREQPRIEPHADASARGGSTHTV